MSWKDGALRFIESGFSAEDTGAYKTSVAKVENGTAFMMDAGTEDLLLSDIPGLTGAELGNGWVASQQTHEACQWLRGTFAYTAPSAVLKKDRTVGVGDRLGIAAPGHIRAFAPYDAVPVFAQQSIRELNLTNRTFHDVLDASTWYVFREGYRGGFGADGDHLKTPAEVEYALSCGYTMITLDCSEHIRNDVTAMTDAQAEAAWTPCAEKEALYLGRVFDVEGSAIAFDRNSLIRASLIYDEAIDFAARIYGTYFAGRENDLDFEISIDETMTPTSPEQHYYVASELARRGVQPVTVAPRFIGEFQKGIDYIGDVAEFEKEFRVHAAIARAFGYKISVHSGSDKFSVFSAVGKYTRGRFHVKTAGTNWLEAMKIIAAHEPALYREIHEYALNTAFAEASRYYHVTTDLDAIPALASLTDAELPGLFGDNNARQLIHITYGLILTAQNADGGDRFRTRLYSAWRTHAEEYAEALRGHIGHHLEMLYKGINA